MNKNLATPTFDNPEREREREREVLKRVGIHERHASFMERLKS